MAAKDYAMLLFTDLVSNNYKFYELTLNEDDSVFTRWGRVDSAGQSKMCHGGRSEFQRILQSKLAKGYAYSKTVAMPTSSSPAVNSKIVLAEAAKRDLLGSQSSSVLINLVDKLTQMNRHQIAVASNNKIIVNEDGLVKTSLGMVTLDTINEARGLLTKLDKYISKNQVSSNQYIDLLTNYMTLIPQKAPTRGGWYEKFFTEHTSLSAQSAFLDQLESSIDLYKSKEAQMRQQLNQTSPLVDKLFSTRLELVQDAAVIKGIEKYFNDHKIRGHESYHLKLKNVFELYNDDIQKEFATVSKKMGNVQRLWHGTRVFNVLSILKNGLIIPKSGGSYHITGRMFGDGLYFSDESTKSLNYSYGFWDGGARDNNCFMFLADVAMGKSYVPASHRETFPARGYDSVFAKAGASGVKNNEMIVYSLKQAQLRYLCEFADK